MKEGMGRWLLALEAFALLGLMRLLIALIPFRRLQSLSGRPVKGEEIALPPLSAWQELSSRRVGWALRAAARRTPWRSACLAQALAGRWMLRRRGIPSVIHFGARIDEGRRLRAHAWLRCGPRILTGGEERAAFQEISAFH
jgi:hypothetical protein